jgi:hypothetical protein
MEPRRSIVSFTAFDSYLAKFIVDNAARCRPVFEKINRGIIQYLNDPRQYEQKFHKETHRMDNKTHALYTHTHEPQDYVLDERIRGLLEHPERLENNFDLFMLVHFYKFFFEDITINPDRYKELAESPERSKGVPSLFELARKEIMKDPDAMKKLKATTRPDELFKERGRISHGFGKKATNSLGIFKEAETPEDLKKFFGVGVYAAKDEFTADPNSSAPLLMLAKQLQLPFVSSASGTASKLIPAIILLAGLSPQELKDFTTCLAGSMVAEGHHSFLEVMVICQRAGIHMNLSPTTPLVNIYESFLSNNIKSAPEFKELHDELKKLSAQAEEATSGRDSAPGMSSGV